jgi:hypothetical protein
MNEDAEHKAQVEISRGVSAQSILDNPLYQEAMIAMRGELLSLFEETKFKDVEERNEIWRKLRTAGWFESYLERVMRTGKLAEQSLFNKVKSRFMR